MPGPCPTPERLAAALRGRQPGGGDAELATHLAECAACQAQLESLAGGSGWLGAKARTHQTIASNPSKPLERAMHELESNADIYAEAPAPPKLDFLQPSDQPGMLGRFGPYEVIAHVASGGMGIVLKAHDPALDRIVALKILPPALAVNSLARARFVREARAAAAVVHEHVVAIYAVDECAGLPYIVMQFVHGRSLSERIRETGPLRLEEILRIGAQTAAGLAAAHAQGLIHRDVKPGNILLENSVERVKLTDFGLARAVDDAGLTRTGELAGTPEFMAPEQAGNEAVDHRADLFSLGSVLYAMSTGVSPFGGASVLAAIRKVCDEQPRPVRDINPNLPRWLSNVIAKLMAKSSAERFQSAKEVGELLERYLARVQHGELGELADHRVRPESTHSRRRLSYVVGGVILMAAVGFLLIALKDRRVASPAASPQPASQPEFAVRNEAGKALGQYAELTEALRAVPADGALELRWNGPREMPPVTLPVKPLTLRAAAGFRPIWVNTNLTVSAITASAALAVEDIELTLRADAKVARDSPRSRSRLGPSGIGLIAISNAPLRLSRCVLQLPDPRSQPPGNPLGGLRLAVIVLDNVTSCDLENTALLADPWTAIFWRHTAYQNANVGNSGSEARLSLSNCLVTAFRVFKPELPENLRARLQMVRCTFHARLLIDFAENSMGRSITVTAQTNLFVAFPIIRDGHSASRELLTPPMRWLGSGNLFGKVSLSQSPPGYIVLVRAARESWPDTLARWNEWWPEPEVGSREVTLNFAGAANVPASASTMDFIRAAYTIDRITPLSPDQWSSFGADLSAVGPASR